MRVRTITMILAILVLLVGLPQTVTAHSHIESTIPAEGETVEEMVDSIELSFDGGVEQGATVQITTKQEKTLNQLMSRLTVRM